LSSRGDRPHFVNSPQTDAQVATLLDVMAGSDATGGGFIEWMMKLAG
jgi:hypothetical protein